MKTKLFVAALFIGLFSLSSFKKVENIVHKTIASKHDPSYLGNAVAPNGDDYEIYGTIGTGPSGEDTVTGVVNVTTTTDYVAIGHTYLNGTVTYVTCTVYNPNGSVKAHINSPLLIEV